MKRNITYPFVCNDWLAVESRDGQIERLLPIASDEEMTQFHVVFSKRIMSGIFAGCGRRDETRDDRFCHHLIL